MSRYTAGMADWLARMLPFEGQSVGSRTAGSVARRDVPVCTIHDHAETVRAAMDRAGRDFCLVLGDERVVLGRVRRSTLGTGAIEDVMDPGPATTRADTTTEELVERLEAAHVTHIVVTNPDGVLIGVAFLDDLRG